MKSNQMDILYILLSFKKERGNRHQMKYSEKKMMKLKKFECVCVCKPDKITHPLTQKKMEIQYLNEGEYICLRIDENDDGESRKWPQIKYI